MPENKHTPDIANETTLMLDGVGGNRIAATLTLPQGGDNSRRGVVLLHGWGGTRSGPHRILVTASRMLAARHITSIRIDLRGRGESDGKAEDANLDDMIEDAVLAARYLMEKRSCATVDFLGMCSGGNIAIGAATLLTDTYKAASARLALLSTLPFSAREGKAGRFAKVSKRVKQYARKACSPETWKRLFRGEINFKGVSHTISASAHEGKSERKLKDSSRDIMADFQKLRPECIFIYGGADPEAAPAWEHYRKFCDANQIKTDSVFVESANHNFYSVPWKTEALDAAVDFLASGIQ